MKTLLSVLVVGIALTFGYTAGWTAGYMQSNKNYEPILEDYLDLKTRPAMCPVIDRAHQPGVTFY